MPSRNKAILASRTHREASLLPPEVLHSFEGQAALLLDAVGTIRAATQNAADLLNKPAAELTGQSFGIVPPHPLRVQLDLAGPAGSRRVIAARSLPSEVGRNWNVAILEDCGASHLVRDAAEAALAASRRLLRDRKIALQAAEWPHVNATPSLRFLLADTIACLVDLTGNTGGVLRMHSRLTTSQILIALRLSGGQRRDPENFRDRFEDTLRRVEAAGAFLRLEIAGNGLELHLVAPLDDPQSR